MLMTGLDRIEIQSLGLPKRLGNCLVRSGIRTVGELVDRSEIELFRLDSVSVKTVRSVKTALAEHGLRLREPSGQVVPETSRRGAASSG